MKQLTINLTENAHPHAEMMIAKAADASLVMHVNTSSGWVKTNSPIWDEDFEYFLCLPKHEKECLHWLNGGKVQGRRCSLNWPDICENPVQVTTHWVDFYGVEEWDKGNLFMSDYYEFRIKTKKEKRWIGVSANGITTNAFDSQQEAYDALPDCKMDWGIYEIEVEVTQ